MRLSSSSGGGAAVGSDVSPGGKKPSPIFPLLLFLKMYVFLVVLGLRGCAGASL